MSASRKSKGKVNENVNFVDAHIGRQIRTGRTLIGMTQEQLGKAIGLTFQQIQKYENGTNRVKAALLPEIAKIFDRPLGWFYPSKTTGITPAFGFSDNKQEPLGPLDVAANKHKANKSSDTQKLIHMYNSIKDPKIKRDVHEFVKNLISKERK